LKSVTIYTTQLCGFCHAAKRLLDGKSVPFTEIDVGRDPELRAQMTEKAGGRRSVPQIFIGETHVGGFDDMNALERTGKLDGLLEA